MGALYQHTNSLEAAAFPSPSSELRERLHGLEKSEDDDHWTKLLDESEQVIGQPEGRGWLDLQRYSLITMAALGHENAERACKAVLSNCLRDHPHWPQLLFKDGTPCASEATRGWIRTQKMGGASDFSNKVERLRESENPSATSENPPDGELGAVPREVDPWDEAQTLVRAGNISEAIAVMARGPARHGPVASGSCEHFNRPSYAWLWSEVGWHSPCWTCWPSASMTSGSNSGRKVHFAPEYSPDSTSVCGDRTTPAHESSTTGFASSISQKLWPSAGYEVRNRYLSREKMLQASRNVALAQPSHPIYEGSSGMSIYSLSGAGGTID